MPSKLNQLAKRELVDLFQDLESGVVIDFTGIGSEETYSLRKTLRQQNVSLRVVKASLARVALSSVGTGFNTASFEGPVGIAYGDDPVAVVKALLAHRKENRGTTLKIKGGFLERKALAPSDVQELSNLPSRQQLLGMVAGTIAAPLTAFIGVQAGIIRKLLYAFDALREKREGAQ